MAVHPAYTVADIPPVANERYTTGSVTSKDGTKIGYRQIGYGPGLGLVQGSLGTVENYMSFAEALANTFTVYMAERRGRGMSGSGNGDPSIQKEIEDIDAILTETGAHFIYGLSSGAVIALQAALTLPAIQKAVIYEPPLFVNGAPLDLLRRYEKEIAQGKTAAALITAMQATHLGPPIFDYLPRWLLEMMTGRMMASQDKTAKPGEMTMRKFAPTLRYDFRVIEETLGKLEIFRAMQPDILLLGGSKSPAFLKTDLDALEKVLPHVTRIEFPGLGHAASWNYDKQVNPDGKPEVVADAVRQFLGG